MQSTITPKSVMLSIVYLIAVVIVLFLLNLGVEAFLNHVILPSFDWFNSRKLVWKIFLLLVGGYVVITFLMTIVNVLATFLNRLVLSWFPINVFNLVASMILAVANAIFSIVVLWKMPVNYNFWIVLELILVSVFIWSLNFIVIMRSEKEKTQ